jgi:hypothetical protein
VFTGICQVRFELNSYPPKSIYYHTMLSLVCVRYTLSTDEFFHYCSNRSIHPDLSAMPTMMSSASAEYNLIKLIQNRLMQALTDTIIL